MTLWIYEYEYSTILRKNLKVSRLTDLISVASIKNEPRLDIVLNLQGENVFSR